MCCLQKCAKSELRNSNTCITSVEILLLSSWMIRNQFLYLKKRTFSFFKITLLD